MGLDWYSTVQTLFPGNDCEQFLSSWEETFALSALTLEELDIFAEVTGLPEDLYE